MKHIFIIVSLLVMHINADEIKRIESIVQDITKLRTECMKTEDKLTYCELKLSDEKQRSALLLKEIEKLENKIENLNNQIKNLKKSKNTKIKEKVIVKEKVNIYLNNQIKEKNEFPQLKMKNEEQKTHSEDGVVYREAYTYRLSKDAKIYDSVDGNIVDEWEEKTSFTSNYKTQNWIRVTGYFVERVWQKSKKELWVQSSDAQQR